MGRKKIETMTIIPDDRLRQVTYCKRKKGLLKKIMEISILCGIRIQLLMEDVTHSKFISYQTKMGEDLFQSAKKSQIREFYSNQDYEKLNQKKNDGQEEIEEPTIEVKEEKNKKKEKKQQEKTSFFEVTHCKQQNKTSKQSDSSRKQKSTVEQHSSIDQEESLIQASQNQEASNFDKNEQQLLFKPTDSSQAQLIAAAKREYENKHVKSKPILNQDSPSTQDTILGKRIRKTKNMKDLSVAIPDYNKILETQVILENLYNEKLQQIQSEKSEKNTCGSSTSHTKQDETMIKGNPQLTLLSTAHVNPQSHLKYTDSIKSSGYIQQQKTPTGNYGYEQDLHNEDKNERKFLITNSITSQTSNHMFCSPFPKKYHHIPSPAINNLNSNVEKPQCQGKALSTPTLLKYPQASPRFPNTQYKDGNCFWLQNSNQANFHIPSPQLAPEYQHMQILGLQNIDYYMHNTHSNNVNQKFHLQQSPFLFAERKGSHHGLALRVQHSDEKPLNENQTKDYCDCNHNKS